jgi:polyhydroxyalkanoate synthesis regulator phasin
MKSLKEKLERIQIAWNEDQHHKLVFEWVKTGVLSLSEFREAIDLISQLDEDESRKLWG